jgi:hypothetical protein
MSFKLGIVFALVLGMAAMFVNAGILIVDVREEGPEGHCVFVPVPLALARTALWFVPDHKLVVDKPEFAEHRELALRLLRELEKAEDADLVEVTDGDERVLVRKVGNQIEVHVSSDRENVDVRVPLAVVTRILESYDEDRGRFCASALSAALGYMPRGEVVHVVDGDEEVKISVW